MQTCRRFSLTFFLLASAEVFNYFVCAVCPVKEPTADLRFFYDVNEFHVTSSGPILNGRKYILIPADEGMEVNGVAVNIHDD